MRFNLAVPLLVLLGACGGDDGGSSPDAASNVPAMITISGTASARDATGSTPQEGVAIAAYRNSDVNTPVVSATTDASGNYTLVIPTNGMALDGFVKATKAGLLDTYLYPPRALVADFDGASINMITSGTLDLLSNTLCGNAQDTAKGVIAVLVVDAADMPVAGATISASPTPGKICYNSGGFPNRNATMTDTDGIAYVLNIGPGDAMVTAAKSGLTYRMQKVTARAGVFTTTPIQP
jgi:hypothetical protein